MILTLKSMADGLHSSVMTQSSALELFHFCFQVEFVFFFLYME